MNLEDVIRRGLAAARPVATSVPAGTLYYSTDTATTDRSTGLVWETYSDIGAFGITELTGDVIAGPGSGSQVATIAANAVGTAEIVDDNVTYAKIQNVSATDRLLGRDTAAAGNIEEIPVSSGLEFTGGPGLRVTQAVRTEQIGVTVDGGGSVLTTGPKGFKSFMVAGTIIRWRLMADQGGSIEFNIFKDAYVSFPSTTSIVAAAPPAIVADTDAEDTVLTGWDTTVNAGDVFAFEIVSVTTIQRVTLELTILVN